MYSNLFLRQSKSRERIGAQTPPDVVSSAVLSMNQPYRPALYPGRGEGERSLQ